MHTWQTRHLLPTGARVAAPAFALHDLQGRRWSNADLRERPTVVYFFAPWCAVCAASSPQLRWFSRLRGDDVRVLLVGLDWQHVEELREYASRHDLGDLPVLIGSPSTGAAWRVPGYPTYYVLDGAGRVARKDFGVTTIVGLWFRTLGLTRTCAS